MDIAQGSVWTCTLTWENLPLTSNKKTDWSTVCIIIVKHHGHSRNVMECCLSSAHSALTHSLIGCWAYVMRTIPDIAPLSVPYHLRMLFVCVLFLICCLLSRNLFSLPCRLGEMGIVNPMYITDSQFDASVRVMPPEGVNNGPITDCFSTRCLVD